MREYETAKACERESLQKETRRMTGLQAEKERVYLKEIAG